MKQILRVVTVAVLVALLNWGSVASGFAQEATGRPFITKWQGKVGEELKIPIVGTDYKLVIKDEQGKVVKSEEKVTVTDYDTFTPKADGVYTVEAGPEGVKSMQMRAEMEDMWNSIPMTSNARLLEVVQFGTVAWASMERMFWLCRNMTFAAGIDTPDLTKVTAMSGMFWGCDAFNQPLEKWDVSKVTNMFAMFNDCIAFNQPLEKWDVSQVTDMSVMFRGCSAFNQPLEKWTVRQVTNMSEMFSGCRAFNQPLEKWNVSQVTNMFRMFYFCHAFNQPLEKWDVGKVTNMSEMFDGCSSFNQPLEKWDVSKVINMRHMFWSCRSFNQPLEKWDVSKVTYMTAIFYGCRAFNQPLEKWDVSKVTNMSEMFRGCSAFNQPLEKWDVSKVTSMFSMFLGCSAFNQKLEKWDVSQVINMKDMFKECKSFNHPLRTWKLRTAIGGLSTTAMSAVNYSLSLIGWAKQTDGASNIPFGENVKGLVYNDAGREAREKLIARGWTFEGDVYKPSEKVAISLAQEGEGTLAIEGYNNETLKTVVEGTELTVIATPKEGYTLTALTAGTQDIFATKKFIVTGAVTVKAVFKKKENNGGGNNGGGWQPQTPQAVEDAVLASLVVAPNPFTSQLRIDNPDGVAVRYELVNAAGVVVRAGAFSATEVIVDTEAFPAGLYFVRIEAQNGAKRVVKVFKY